MPAPSWENLDDFFDTDTNGGFAFPAVIHFRKGGTRTINAIFDDPYFDAQLGEYKADSSTPRLTAKESDTVGIMRGDTIEIAGEMFDVTRTPEQDGTGTVTIRMARQDDKL